MNFRTFYESKIKGFLKPMTREEIMQAHPELKAFMMRDREEIIRIAKEHPSAVIRDYDTIGDLKKSARENSIDGANTAVLAVGKDDIGRYPFGFTIIAFMNPDLKSAPRFIPLFMYKNGEEEPIEDLHKGKIV